MANDELILPGFVSDDDLVGLYNLAKVFIFPSWHEGFGLPVLEAMACGTAVLAANTSSLPEVVGRSDALFDPMDAAAIAAALQRVLTGRRPASEPPRAWSATCASVFVEGDGQTRARGLRGAREPLGVGRRARGMKRPVVVVLSDEHIGSYAVIGELLVRTLSAVGVAAEHRPLSAARTPGATVPRALIAIHNTIGPRFAPLPGCRNVAMVHHEWDRYPKGWVDSLNAFSEVWVTTAFVKQTLANSGVVAPIVLLRPALDVDPIPVKVSYDIRRPVRSSPVEPHTSAKGITS